MSIIIAYTLYNNLFWIVFTDNEKDRWDMKSHRSFK